jgi:hypothetical protein
MARRNERFRRGDRVWWLPNEGSQRQVTILDDSDLGLVTIVDGASKLSVRRYELSARPFQGIPLHTGNDAA